MQIKNESMLSEEIVNAISALVNSYVKKGKGSVFSLNMVFDRDTHYEKIVQKLKEIDRFVKSINDKKHRLNDVTVIELLVFTAVINSDADPHYLDCVKSIFSPFIKKIPSIIDFTIDANIDELCIIPDNSDKRLEFIELLLSMVSIETNLKQNTLKLIEDNKNLTQEHLSFKKLNIESEKKWSQENYTLKQKIVLLEKELESAKKHIEQQTFLIKNQGVLSNFAKVLEGGNNFISNQQSNINNTQIMMHHDQLTAPPPPPAGEQPKLPEFKSLNLVKGKAKNETKDKSPKGNTNQPNQSSIIEEMGKRRLETQVNQPSKSGCDIIFMKKCDTEVLANLKMPSNAIYVVSHEAIYYRNIELNINKLITKNQDAVQLYLDIFLPTLKAKPLTIKQLTNAKRIIGFLSISLEDLSEKDTQNSLQSKVSEAMSKLRPQIEDSEEESDEDAKKLEFN